MDSITVGLVSAASVVSFAASYCATDTVRVPVREHRVSTYGLDMRLKQVLLRIPGIQDALDQRKRAFKKALVISEMPHLLDILTLGLSAGLSFDASIELYCDQCEGDFSRLLREVLLVWRMGLKSREEALSDLADEIDVAAVRRFSATVIEALSFGSPLAQVLEQQAAVLRDEQRAEIEEEIEKVPVKMLIPLGTLIVPAMLLSILGPLISPALSISS